MTLYKNYIIIFGGDDGSGELSDIIVYEHDKNTWQTALTIGEVPEARQGHTACLYKENKIVFYGGINNHGVSGQTEMMIIQDEGDGTFFFER